MANLRTKDGVELTPEVLEELAREAEAGYDLSKAKLVRRGRPSLSGSGRSAKIQIRIDPELNRALRELSEAQNRTVSDIAREALRKHVAGA